MLTDSSAIQIRREMRSIVSVRDKNSDCDPGFRQQNQSLVKVHNHVRLTLVMVRQSTFTRESGLDLLLGFLGWTAVPMSLEKFTNTQDGHSRVRQSNVVTISGNPIFSSGFLCLLDGRGRPCCCPESKELLAQND